MAMMLCPTLLLKVKKFAMVGEPRNFSSNRQGGGFNSGMQSRIRVDFGDFNAATPEQILHDANIGASFQLTG